MSIALLEVHHLAMIPVAQEQEIFALRDRARLALYDIVEISEPQINFPDFAGTRDTLGGPFRNVSIMTVVPRIDPIAINDIGRDIIGEHFAGSLIQQHIAPGA